MQLALHFGFHIHIFNQLRIKNIFKKCCIVVDVYYVVRPMMVASVLNLYRLFCYYFLNNIYMVFTLY